MDSCTHNGPSRPACGTCFERRQELAEQHRRREEEAAGQPTPPPGADPNRRP